MAPDQCVTLREAGKLLALNARNAGVLDDIVHLALKLSGGGHASLRVAGPGQEGFTLASQSGGDDRSEPSKTETTLTERSAAERRTLHDRDEGVLAVPIVFGGEAVGVLTITGPTVANIELETTGNLEALAGQAALLLEVRSGLQATADNYRGMVITFAEAVEGRDSYTLGHSKAVRDYAVGIGSKLGLDTDALSRLELAGLLHDIGKLTIADSILKKESRLTNEEMEVVKTHPTMGARLLEPVDFFGAILPAVRHHHEHYDGSGYPDGLIGEDIPFDARILAIADAFDAMSSKRVYRQFLSTDAILSELKKGRGRQFDPRILDAFLRAFEIDRKVYRAGHMRLSEVIHDKYFDYYALAVRDTPAQVEDTVALMAEVTESLLRWLSAYGGPVVTERTEKKMNAYSIENGLDFILAKGRMKTHTLVPVTLVELIKRFQAYINYLARAIGETVSMSVGKVVVHQASRQLNDDAKLLMDQTLGATRFFNQAA